MNKIKKRFILGIMLTLCSLGLKAGNEFLLVTQKNGQQTGFALIDQPKIECLSGFLTVTSVHNTISVPLDDIINFEFVNEIPSGIITLRYNNNDVKVNSGHVVISSLPSKSIVNIYNINGTILEATALKRFIPPIMTTAQTTVITIDVTSCGKPKPLSRATAVAFV